MIQLLVNADDLGLSRGVNHGILDAHRFGIVNSTTMLVNMPGTAHAVELLNHCDNLRVGIHLTLTCGKAVSPKVPSLTTSDGYFKMNKRSQMDLSDRLDEVEREWEAQIKQGVSMGLEPTHFDSHHHIHAKPELLPVVQALSKKYALPVRNIFGNKNVGVDINTDLFFSDFYNEKVSLAYFNTLTERVQGADTLEIMCHPAYLDFELRNQSSYQEKRVEELYILTNIQLTEEFSLL